MAQHAGRSIWSMPNRFNKRIFADPASLRRELDYLLKHPSELKAAFRSGRISHPFAERIMLAVTGVNGCRYCSFGHAQAAAQSGISEEEVAQLLTGDLDRVDPAEAVALAFAMHFADSNGNPLPEMVAQLETSYGADAACDILMIIRMIMLGNLAGNTFDALLYRLRGRPAEGSSWQNEVATLGLLTLGAIPFALAFAIQMALVEAAESSDSNVLVLQA